METRPQLARPMTRDQMIAYLLRTHGHGNPEILRAFLFDDLD